MMTIDEINNTLQELYGIQKRAEEEYYTALTSYSNSYVGSTGSNYFYNMILFIGEILGYSNQKISQDIQEYEHHKG